MAEVAQIIYAASLANSGTANPAFAIPIGTQEVIIVVAAEYAACAATTGVNVALDISYDNGSTYSASAQTAVEVPGVATTLESQTIVYRMGNDPFHPDQAVPTNLKIALTNNDATNAAVVAVAIQPLSHQA